MTHKVKLQCFEIHRHPRLPCYKFMRRPDDQPLENLDYSLHIKKFTFLKNYQLICFLENNENEICVKSKNVQPIPVRGLWNEMPT